MATSGCAGSSLSVSSSPSLSSSFSSSSTTEFVTHNCASSSNPGVKLSSSELEKKTQSVTSSANLNSRHFHSSRPALTCGGVALGVVLHFLSTIGRFGLVFRRQSSLLQQTFLFPLFSLFQNDLKIQNLYIYKKKKKEDAHGFHSRLSESTCLFKRSRFLGFRIHSLLPFFH